MRLVAAGAIVCGLVIGVCGVAASPVDAADTGSRASATRAIDNGVDMTRTLDALASAPGGTLAATAGNLGDLERILNAGPIAAHTVTTWWSALSGTERIRLEGTLPTLIGNLDGLPLDVRTRANASTLRARMTALGNSAKSGDTRAGAELTTLRQLSRALVAGPGQPRRSLLSFDDSGSVMAAIAIGDPARARRVTVLVPGMLYSVRAQAVDWATTAAVLDRAERSWAKRVAGGGGSIATIAWLGYQTPDVVGAVSIGGAEQGARRLTSALAGLRAARAGNEPYITVVGHSYGSTVALLALTHAGVRADALALLGSPGGGAASARALNVADGRVYVGAAELDPIAGCGYFGSNPYAARYGAHRMGVDGGTDPIDGRALTASIGHNGYFGPRSESIRNLALIAIGRSDLVDGS